MPNRSDAFLLVVNPRAGAGRAGRLLGSLERALRKAGARFETALTRARHHATELVRDGLASGYCGIAVVGGDGTLNEALNGFFGAGRQPIAPGAWLGLLPSGTGGDFRRTAKVGRGTRAMITHLLSTAPRPIDIGWVRFTDDEGRPRERAFLNIASFGMSGLVDRLVDTGPKWLGGAAAYGLCTLRALALYESARVRLTVDDGPTRELAISNIAVANGRCFGGGMQIAPAAEIDDGLFEVVVIPAAKSWLTQAGLASHLYRGTLLGRPGIHFDRGTRITAEPTDPTTRVLLDIDGEAPGVLPATFELAKGALLFRA